MIRDWTQQLSKPEPNQLTPTAAAILSDVFNIEWGLRKLTLRSVTWMILFVGRIPLVAVY